ncbi:radical SAM protein [Candidatus Woesearchaeota archaeon]|nr:radical SAM protein [Candidatus Woesearchaeota archaeon]
MQITPALLDKAASEYNKYHPHSTTFSKCLFLSWHCSVGDCTFCYRSTIKQTEDPKKQRRRLASIFVEGLVSKVLGYDLEFITGGYGIYPVDEMVEIARVLSHIFGEKIWVNLGVMNKIMLQRFKPYVQGVVASIETINPDLRQQVCPSKPMSGYLQLYNNAEGFKKSCAFIVGLGESVSDLDLLHDFIREHSLDQITFYALKPVKGTPFTVGPPIENYAWWVAKTRIAFPRMRIIAGITGRRANDVGILLKAGANVITKFPALRMFGSKEAMMFEEQLRRSGRSFDCTLTVFPVIDWNALIEALPVSMELKSEMLEVIPRYVKRLKKTCVSSVRGQN